MAEAVSQFQVVMPRLGLTMIEAKITEWLKAEGAWVNKGEGLFVLEHEKATLEIESPGSGFLHILVPLDQVVPILTPVAVLEGGDSSSPSFVKADLPPTIHVQKGEAKDAEKTLVSKASGPVQAAPKARLLARKLGISLDGLTGSGVRGMIVASDVEAALAAGDNQKPSTPLQAPSRVSPVAQKLAQERGFDPTRVSGSGPRGQVMKGDIEKAIRATVSAPNPFAAISPSPDISTIKGLRGIIANRLSASWIERPQVTLTTEADATYLVALRQQIQVEWDTRISYNAILIKLVAKALGEFPYMNSQLTSDGIRQMPEINTGLAVDTERGLVVPVVRNADQKSVFQIQSELQVLTERALQGRSLPDDLVGGTFTVTNLGVYEIDAFTPIINPPECAILGVGRIVAKPTGLNGQVVLRDTITLSLSFDHRLVDGSPAARFLQRVKTLIERCVIFGLEKEA